MAISPQDRLRTLQETDPSGPAWPQAALSLEQVFNRLDDEDQMEAVKRLAAAGAAGLDTLARLDSRGSASLSTLVELRQALVAAGRPVDAEILGRLQKWLARCESGDDCGPDDLFGLAPAERTAVINHLARWLQSDLLARLADAAPDKAAAKEIKKALHRARSAGAAAVAGVTGEAFVLPEREEYLDEAFLSPPNAAGVSYIYLYRTVFGRNTMFVIVAGDTDGILNFDAYEAPESKYRKLMESARSDPRLVLARADSGYVRRLIRQAEENGRRAGKTPPPDYLRTRRALGIADEPDHAHPVFQHFPAEELAKETGLVARSAGLADHRLFADWVLIPVDENTFMLKLEEARNSLLTLTAAQKREQEDRLFEQEVERIVATTGPLTWRERLLQCAYLAYLVGYEPVARMIAATALAVGEGRTPPLLVELLRRAVDRVQGGQSDPGPAPEPDGKVIL